jgi:hypothetical protein
MKMREGMFRAICAVSDERSENRLYYRKHDGIAQFYYEQVSLRCGEAKSISIQKRRRRPKLTPASLFCLLYNISYLSRTLKTVCW